MPSVQSERQDTAGTAAKGQQDGQPVGAQTRLFDAPRNYHGRPPFESGSETSRAAADSVEDISGELRRRVYECILANRGLGRTDDEIECVTGLIHQTASARRRELYLAGRIVKLVNEDGPIKRPTRSGRMAQVYVATASFERVNQ